jgi:cell fate regulator YaaT (PSP1 superfamily)
VVAKTQQLFPNPQKLAGQCGKLKCCLNYEYDVYVESLNKIPELGVDLETEKGKAIYHKVDVFKRLFWYSYQGSTELFPLSAKSVRYIMDKNAKNIAVKDLESFAEKLDKDKNSQKQDFNEDYN